MMLLWCSFVFAFKHFVRGADEKKDCFETFARNFLPGANISDSITGKLFTYPLPSIRSKSFEDAVVSTTAE